LVLSENFHFSFREKEEYNANHNELFLETHSEDNNLVVDDQEEACEIKTNFKEVIQEQNEDHIEGNVEKLVAQNPDIPVFHDKVPDMDTSGPKKLLTREQGNTFFVCLPNHDFH
jgi:hypothetical protein